MAVKQNEIEDIKTKFQHIQVEMSRLRARGVSEEERGWEVGGGEKGEGGGCGVGVTFHW